MKMKIGSRFVGSCEHAFIIAEAGANHNRDFDMAKVTTHLLEVVAF